MSEYFRVGDSTAAAPLHASDSSYALIADASAGSGTARGPATDADTYEPQHASLPVVHIETYPAKEAPPKEPLPAVVLAGSATGEAVSDESDWLDGTWNVISDLAEGAYDAVVDHPLELLETAVEGAVVGAAIAVAGTVGVVVGAVAAVGYAGYELYEHGEEWGNNISTVFDPTGKSPEEIAAAHAGLHDMGGGIANLAAGAVGGVAGAWAVGAVAGGEAAAVTESASVSEAASVTEAAAQPRGLTIGNPADVASGLEANQAIMARAAAGEGDSAIVPSVKQLYDVKFTPVKDEAGVRIFTTENPVEGEIAPKGSFVAERLGPDGQPVYENGMKVTWQVVPARVVKAYAATEEQLAAGESFVASTKVGAPAVHMSQLKEPIEFVTNSGKMSGKPGDWLANYDYDVATGRPGTDFAIVSKASYDLTYKPE